MSDCVVPRAWHCRPNRGALGAVALRGHRGGILGDGALRALWAAPLEEWLFRRLPWADWGHRDDGELELPETMSFTVTAAPHGADALHALVDGLEEQQVKILVVDGA